MSTKDDPFMSLEPHLLEAIAGAAARVASGGGSSGDPYRQFDVTKPWDERNNKELLNKMPSVFAPPGVKTKNGHSTFYRVFTGPGTAFDGKLGLRLALEVVELARFESARVALVVQGQQRLQSAAVVALQPVDHGAGTDAEEFGDRFGRASLAKPEQGGEAVVQARVVLFASQFLDLLT